MSGLSRGRDLNEVGALHEEHMKSSVLDGKGAGEAHEGAQGRCTGGWWMWVLDSDIEKGRAPSASGGV